MEDNQIVDLYWQRSDLAISETNQKYGRYCHTIAYNICGIDEDAEECVNDTWFCAWNLMPDQRPPVLSAFLGRITRSISIDRIKAKNRIKRGGGEATLALEELEECIPGGASPEQALDAKELEAAIGSFVSKLPASEKNIFILRYWYLVPIPEISKKLCYSQGKIKSSLFRTRRKLHDYLQEEGLC